MTEDTQRILDGKPLDGKSENRVDDVPDSFKDWVKDNAGRITRAKSLPYFLRDNGKMKEGKYTLQKFGKTTAQREVRNPLPEHVRERRKEIQRIAYKTLCTQQITVSALSAPVEISKRAVKEWLNQPFADMEAKNEALLSLPELLQNAVYRGYGADKHDIEATAHIFEIMIGDVKSWIIVRERRSGQIILHSISDSPNVLKGKK